MLIKVGEYLVASHDWFFRLYIPPILKVTVRKSILLQGAGLGARPLAAVRRTLRANTTLIHEFHHGSDNNAFRFKEEGKK